MSQTMSSPSDWSQFYNNQRNTNNMFNDGVSDATAVTTTMTSASTPASLLSSGNSGSPSTAHLSPEGRVAKPVRRRSRASRRTPTTLLNTDTTNFRAMVQQFTGGPTAPFGPSGGSQLNTSSLNFGMNPRQVHVNNPMVSVAAAAGYQNLQYQQQTQPSYMFSLGNNTTGTELFFQRLGNPPPVEVTSDGLTLEGEAAAAAAPGVGSRTPPSSSSNENRSNSFLF